MFILCKLDIDVIPRYLCSSHKLAALVVIDVISNTPPKGSLQTCVQELFPALGSDWQQVSKKKSREPFDPNAPSAGGAWARTASTPTKPPPTATPEPTAVVPGPPDHQQPPQERRLEAVSRLCCCPSVLQLRNLGNMKLHMLRVTFPLCAVQAVSVKPAALDQSSCRACV